MRGSVIGHLILKDWRLHRRQIFFTIAGGVLALALAQGGKQTSSLLGAVWFFVALVIFASMLPFSAIVSEKKKQNLAFLMSLPLSSVQYTTAKVVSTLAMFLAPWLALLISALVLINARNILPHGAIPMFFVVAILPVVGFCLIFGTALISESEGWAIAASAVCNSSYWFIWYLLIRAPSLTANWRGRVAVWNSAVLRVLAIEIGISVLFVGLTYFLQSRKRDFV